MSGISCREITYRHYGKCLELSNGTVDLVVTVDLGPRVIRFGLVGGENEFSEDSFLKVPVGADTWEIRGGHRLWHSPESLPRTYAPDNGPVEWRETTGGITVVQPVEPWVQLQKSIEMSLAPDSNRVTLIHRLRNENAWPVEFAAWAVTVLAPGGIEVVPQPRRDTGLLGNRVLALWPYTRMDDPRVTWGEAYILLRQDPAVEAAFKFGLNNEPGWAAYFNHGNLFIKRFTHLAGARYPDFGVSYETYTNAHMLEMETLSPFTAVAPGAVLEHREEWELHPGVKLGGTDAASVIAALAKYV